ncbi:hypothetical protein ABPG75_000110 [Micractinium tetrahymenae]
MSGRDAAPSPDASSGGASREVVVEDLFNDFLFSIQQFERLDADSVAAEAQEVVRDTVEMFFDKLKAEDAEAEDADDLWSYMLGLGHITVAASSPAADDSELPRHSIVDGQHRILALCLLLAAARKCLVTAPYLSNTLSRGSGRLRYDLAQQIGSLLVPEEGSPRVRLASEEDTAFLERHLLNPARKPGGAELSAVLRSRLWACVKLFRWRLEDVDIGLLVLLVQYILTRVIVTVTILPGRQQGPQQAESEAAADSKAPASQVLCLTHLPDASEELAASADLLITLDGCRLPLHSAVLATGCRALRQHLCSAGTVEAAGNAFQTAAAAQTAFEGHALADVQLFLSLLYSGGAAAKGVAEPAPFKGVVALAHALDAPFVLQACEARLLQLLRCNKYWWAEWLALADRYGLHRLQPVAAESALADLLSLPDGASRQAMLHKMRWLSAGTYQVLFEAMVEVVAEAGPLKGK